MTSLMAACLISSDEQQVYFQKEREILVTAYDKMDKNSFVRMNSFAPGCTLWVVHYDEVRGSTVTGYPLNILYTEVLQALPTQSQPCGHFTGDIYNVTAVFEDGATYAFTTMDPHFMTAFAMFPASIRVDHLPVELTANSDDEWRSMEPAVWRWNTFARAAVTGLLEQHGLPTEVLDAVWGPDTSELTDFLTGLIESEEDNED